MKTLLLMLMLAALPGTRSLWGSNLPEARKIDAILAAEWQKNHLRPNPPAPDEVIVRRLYLDIAGRIPTLEETRQFMLSRDPAKRTKLIDALLAGDGYTSHMFNYWADLLRLTENVNGKITAQAYAAHVKRCLKEDKPYDRFVHDLLTAEGGAWDGGAIGFYTRDDNKLDHLAYASEVFLGTTIVCAQCHDHPFDKWTQLQYYGLAAFTYGMGAKGYSDPFGLGLAKAGKGGKGAVPQDGPMAGMNKGERKKYLAEHPDEAKAMQEREAAAQKEQKLLGATLGSVSKVLGYTTINMTEKPLQLPEDYRYKDGTPGQVIQPKTLFGHEATWDKGQSRLEAFAQWMTSPDNPRFTMVIANRMWKKVFGLGVIEPVDEITDSTVPSNGALMEYLTQLMIDKGYSLKSFLRVLFNTEAYQRMASRAELAMGETYHFTGPLLHRMSAEQMWDSLVTLDRGNLDAVTSDENVRLSQNLDYLKALMDAVREKGRSGMLEIAKRQEEERAAEEVKIEELRRQNEATGDTTGERAKNLAAEVRRLAKGSGFDVVAALLGEDRARAFRQDLNGKKGGQAPPVLDKAALAGLSKSQRAAAIELASNATMSARASELPSPERPGHLLRTLGQSDRELIANGNDEATVTQALALLNGPTSEMLVSPQSKLHQALAQAPTVPEKLDLLYLSLLSRHPTRNERVLLEQVAQERGDKAVGDVLHALLLGTQFIFVQ